MQTIASTFPSHVPVVVVIVVLVAVIVVVVLVPVMVVTVVVVNVVEQDESSCGRVGSQHGAHEALQLQFVPDGLYDPPNASTNESPTFRSEPVVQSNSIEEVA